MVKLRLMRVGTTKKPVYRVVAADSRSPRDGRFIEIIGQYDPKPNPSFIEIDEARALHWLASGAQPSDTVTALLKRSGIWQKHVAAHPRKPAKQRERKPKAAAKS
ncbi:MAG TPA: 30S ribosomal protein S16 [Actinomycetota bacterium]|nr:30S ribosomal protein S16 [Actinomycetota bacterium]